MHNQIEKGKGEGRKESLRERTAQAECSSDSIVSAIAPAAAAGAVIAGASSLADAPSGRMPSAGATGLGAPKPSPRSSPVEAQMFSNMLPEVPLYVAPPAPAVRFRLSLSTVRPPTPPGSSASETPRLER